MSGFKCNCCGSSSYSTIRTYKNLWQVCNQCGNITREYRAKRLLGVPVPAWASRIRGLRGLLGALLQKPADVSYYELYLDPERNQSTEIAGGQWDGADQLLLAELASHGVSLEGKSILDISGGPGLVGRSLSKHCASITVTEPNEVVVERMRTMLGLKAFVYDYDLHEIDQLTGESYDLVLIRYSINFCTNIPKLLRGLRQRLNPGAQVYVSWVMPSMAPPLRWQFDDFTYHVLYHPETMRRMFAEAGFSMTHSYPDPPYHYLANLGPMLLFLPIYLFFQWRNAGLRCTRDLVHRQHVMIFESPAVNMV